MYICCFNEWIILNAQRFEQMGMAQNVRFNDGIGELPNPTMVVEHSYGQCIGQITVWESGFMDFEIIDIKSGEQLLWEHRDLDGQPDFGNILEEYLKLLNV